MTGPLADWDKSMRKYERKTLKEHGRELAKDKKNKKKGKG